MSTSSTPRGLVWDLPTRLCHWLLGGSFAVAFITAESEPWRALHVISGYTAVGLIAFRLLWGLVGTRYARFSGFSFAPSRVFGYLKSLLAFRPQHHAGHNPAGSWAVVALLVLVAASGATGWAAFNEVGPGWLGDLHEGFANATLALVVVHVLAVIASSWLHRENLVRAMIDGRKALHAQPAASGPRRIVAFALVAAVLGFWTGWIPAPGLQRESGWAALQSLAPSAIAREPERAVHARGRGGDRDDDD
jgi:cytochrome b